MMQIMRCSDRSAVRIPAGLRRPAGTVRYLSRFLEDPLAVPQPVLRTLAKQLRIAALNKARGYSAGEQRWQHATEIRASYGYVDFTGTPNRLPP